MICGRKMVKIVRFSLHGRGYRPITLRTKCSAQIWFAFFRSFIKQALEKREMLSDTEAGYVIGRKQRRTEKEQSRNMTIKRTAAKG